MKDHLMDFPAKWSLTYWITDVVVLKNAAL